MDFGKLADTRRSVQYFDPSAKIDENLIREIIETATLSPSSFNLQPWKLVLVGDDEWKAKLQECAFNQPKVTQASHVAIVLGDTKAYDEMDGILDDFIEKGYFTSEMKDGLKGMAKNLYSGDNERAFVSRNAGLFAMSLMYAAHERGVSTHPMDGFDAVAVRRVFNIPERYDIVMLVAIGRFDESKTLLPRCRRRNFDEIVVRDKF